MRFRLFLLLLMTFTVSADDWRMVEPETKQEVKPSMDTKLTAFSDYVSPIMTTFIALERAFEQAFRAKDLTALEAYYQIPGKSDQEQSTSVLTSNPDLGWGDITLNHSAQKSLFLQVPHRFYDKGTATIAQHWLQSGRFKLLMVNSVHRHSGRNSKPSYNSDFSTAPKSPFVAATRAFISSFPEPLVLQLHGYSKDKRRSLIAQHSQVILSHGANLPGPYLSKLNNAAECISQEMSLKALVFPHNVRELGGTKNIIGKQLRKRGFYQQFVHIELSKELRDKLLKDSQLSNQLLDCIVEALI